jgi:hypothetical protein
MFVVLYGLLLGILFALILCAPYTYYPLLLSLFAVSVIVYFVSRKLFKSPNRKHYICAAAFFLISYSACTYLIFKPANFHHADMEYTKSDKKAVIFYCEGEMEKYTPYYVKAFIDDKPLLLKPFYAYNIKKIYARIGTNNKNEQLTKIAEEVRISILNYKPYFYYIALSNYVPNLKDSIYSAISDGCKEIIIINYTSKDDIEKEIDSDINLEGLRMSGIDIRFSKSAAATDTFIDYMFSRIVNLPVKPDGILLIGSENNSSKSLKNKLISSGYTENQIIISSNIKSSVKYFEDNQTKSFLYVNIKDSSSGLEGDVYVPAYLEKYCSNMKITGIKDWGYDKKLIKACIEIFLEASDI